MMNEAGWKYEEKDVECYRNSEGEKIYYVEISNHEDNVYVLPDSNICTSVQHHCSSSVRSMMLAARQSAVCIIMTRG